MSVDWRKLIGRWVKASPSGDRSPTGDAPVAAVPAVAAPAYWHAQATATGIDGNDDEFRYNPVELPLPNALLRAAVSGPDLGRFMYIGAAWAEACFRYLPLDRRTTILDIGCGVGKTARFLAYNPQVSYVGFDIYLPAISWCRREFGRLYGERFRFEHFDGQSSMYNPNGSVAVADYRFPADDSSVDLALGASIFTHLYEKDMLHYLAQTSRVLKPGGVALFSIHTPDEIKDFFPDAGVPVATNIVGNEQVMLVDREYFVALGERCGLTLHDLPGRLCGQELVVFQRLQTS
jgi:SAM-dependent methyltransferase